MHEADSQYFAVQVAVEAEQMRLNAKLGAVEGRPNAEIGDARVNFGIELCIAGIDAERRQHMVVPRLHIGGRKANGSSALIPLHDLAHHSIRPRKQTGSLLDVAGLQQFAHASAADRLMIGAGDQLDFVDGEAEFLAFGTQKRDVAFALEPERKPLADPQFAHLHVTRETLDILGGTGVAELIVEGLGDDPVDAEPGQLFSALLRRGQVIAASDVVQHGVGMREKRNDDREAARGLRPLDKLADQMLVADMDAVEHADGDKRGLRQLHIAERGDMVHMDKRRVMDEAK
jgi:hypothetical protein